MSGTLYVILGSGLGGILAGGLLVWRICKSVYGGQISGANAERDQARTEAARMNDLAQRNGQERDDWMKRAADTEGRLGAELMQLRAELELKKQEVRREAAASPESASQYLGRVLQAAAARGATTAPPAGVQPEPTPAGGAPDPNRRNG